MVDTQKVGVFIAQCRKEHNWTQKELGEKLGVTDKAVSKWENGGSLRERYHTNPTLTFAQPIHPEGWITSKGCMSPEEG